MATAQDYLEQIQAMGAAPSAFDLQNRVAETYKNPILKPLADETANLNAQFLPSLFTPFAEMGTGAGDMSAAAKLALIGGSLGRLSSRVGANNEIGNYYKAQIGDVAQGVGQNWQNQNQNLWQLYNAQKQQEQFDKQLQASRAASSGGISPTFPSNGGSTTPTTQGDAGTLARVAIKDGVDLLRNGQNNYNSPQWQNILGRLKQAGFTDPLNQIDFLNFNFNTGTNNPKPITVPTVGISPLNVQSWTKSPGLKWQ